MGMTRRQVLWRVELPLALPLIFAGIRTGTVYVIATAPLAALRRRRRAGRHHRQRADLRQLAGVIAATIMRRGAGASPSTGCSALVQRRVTPTGLRASAQMHVHRPADGIHVPAERA